MYSTLLFCHSLLRWLVLISLVYAIYRACSGYFLNLKFSKNDHLVRHWTATISHVQLLIGMLLYIKSPLIKHFWEQLNEGTTHFEAFFFGVIHLILMLIAIVILTIGSSMAKRKKMDKEKFKTILIWFSIALIIVLIAIPWPFSPFAIRPFIR